MRAFSCPSCENVGEPETIVHLLRRCPRWREQRPELLLDPDSDIRPNRMPAAEQAPLGRLLGGSSNNVLGSAANRARNLPKSSCWQQSSSWRRFYYLGFRNCLQRQRLALISLESKPKGMIALESKCRYGGVLAGESLAVSH